MRNTMNSIFMATIFIFLSFGISFAGESFTIPDKTITIDGVINDWNDIQPVYIDQINDQDPHADFDGTDLEKFYLAKDDIYLYTMMTLHDGPPKADPTTIYFFVANQVAGQADTDGDYSSSASCNNGIWEVTSSVRYSDGTMVDDPKIFPSSYVGLGQDFIEWKVPLTEVGDLNGTFVRAYIHCIGPQISPPSYNVSDENITNIQLICNYTAPPESQTSDSLPYAPHLTVTTTGTYLSLSWTPVENADGYTLFYAPYPEASYIGDFDMGTQTALAGNLNDGDAFYVAIKAYNGNGSSDFSNIEYFKINVEYCLEIGELVPFLFSNYERRITVRDTASNTPIRSFTFIQNKYVAEVHIYNSNREEVATFSNIETNGDEIVSLDLTIAALDGIELHYPADACGSQSTNDNSSTGADNPPQSEMPATGVSVFAGNYSGTFWGTDSGSWQMVINEDGSVTGSGYSSDLQQNFSGEGQVDAEGMLNLVAASVGAYFSGQIVCEETACEITGTWRNDIYDLESGSFSGHRQ